MVILQLHFSFGIQLMHLLSDLQQVQQLQRSAITKEYNGARVTITATSQVSVAWMCIQEVAWNQSAKKRGRKDFVTKIKMVSSLSNTIEAIELVKHTFTETELKWVCSVPYVVVSACKHCASKSHCKDCLLCRERGEHYKSMCCWWVERVWADSHFQFIANPYSSHNQTTHDTNNFAPCPVCQLWVDNYSVEWM